VKPTLKGSRQRFRRGASILPMVFTTGNLFLGFWAIVRVLEGAYEHAAFMVIGAGILDMLDGRIARLTGTTSEFGAELDSLADLISFGVAPAFLAYAWGFPAVPRGSWALAFIFVACGAMRLARFNIQRQVIDARYFVGLPIPAAAGQVVTLVIFLPEGPRQPVERALAVALVLTLSFLMVSTFRYPSFKGFDLRSRRSYISVLPIAVAIAILVLRPEVVLLGVATAYSLSAPTVRALGLLRRRGGPPPAPAPGPVH
jgi:CDP-diacylglycerol--serine O-phosphatidyltransferase